MAVSEGLVPVRANGAGARSGSPTRWLTIREIADDLGVSTSTVYKWSARGRPFFPGPSDFETVTSASAVTVTKPGWRRWRLRPEASSPAVAHMAVCDAGYQLADAVVLSARGDALVDVEEHREGLVAGPALADDGVDAFTQPPGAGGVA